MNEQSLFATFPAPPRLPKMVIPQNERGEIIDYFTALATQHSATSYDGCRIQRILRTLQRADDPIGDLQTTARQERLPYQRDIYELYQVALEMLYVVRHRLETEWLKRQEHQQEP